MLGSLRFLAFRRRRRRFAREMSLNRLEQTVLDFVQGHPEERQYWKEKVLRLSKTSPDPGQAAERLERELWAYVEERSRVSEPIRNWARQEGLRRTSLRNLSDYWLRLWSPPYPRNNTN